MRLQAISRKVDTSCIVDSFSSYPAMHINTSQTACIGVGACVIVILLLAIHSHSFKKADYAKREFTDQTVDANEFEDLVQQERWEAAFDDKYLAWEIRVGDAHISIYDSRIVSTAFFAAKYAIEDKSTQSKERKHIRKKMLSLLRAHTFALVSQHGEASGSDNKCKAGHQPTFTRASAVNLWKLLPGFIDAIRLYKNKVCPTSLMSETGLLVDAIIRHKETSKEDAKRLIELMLQLHTKACFPRDLTEYWMYVLGDGDCQKAKSFFLDNCKASVAREEWQKALVHYFVYAQSCSRVPNSDLPLLVQIHLLVTLENTANTRMVDNAFALATIAVSKGIMSRTEKCQSISRLYDVFEARVKNLLSPGTVIDLDFLRNMDGMNMDIPFLARLECCSVWRKFLKVCACSGEPLLSHVVTQLVQRETNHGRAKRMVDFALNHNPDLSDYNPEAVEAWMRKGYLKTPKVEIEGSRSVEEGKWLAAY